MVWWLLFVQRPGTAESCADRCFVLMIYGFVFGMAFNAEVVMHHLWDGEASIVAIVGSKTCNYCKQNQTH